MLGRYRLIAQATDASAAILAGVLAARLRFESSIPLFYVIVSLLVPFTWIVLIYLQRGYEYRFIGTGVDEYRCVLNAGVLLFTVIAVASYAVRAELSRGYVLLAVPTTILLTLVGRNRLRWWLYRLRAQGQGMQRVIVVGRADATVSVIETLDREPHHGLVAVGACVPNVGIQVSHVHGVPVLGDPERILDAVDRTGAHVVAVVSHPDLAGQALRRLSWALEERGVELVVSPGIIEVAGPRLSIRPVAGLSLLHLERPSARGGRMILKAVLDRVLSLALVVAISPLLLLIAVAVKLDSRGPALFRQTRIGVDGREFTMLKFRSMVVDAERLRDSIRHLSEGNEILFKMKDDPRITRVGAILRRFSLDELPQLFNIIRGDMSLVGPRPPLPEEVAVYTDDAVRRLRVRPGLTGLWQVSGRSDLSWEETLRLDLRYVDNWSLALDLSILWRTVRAVVHGSGAY
ncbi:MAG: sugar transferase [Actinomycetales bacterium]|nr:sugar transferase [Actinomycetales bacterium]